MPAALFLRITGVPWDEFRVAWRLYFGEHGRRIILLAIVLFPVSLLYCLITMKMVFPAIDLDGPRNFFLSLSDVTWRNPTASPIYLLAVIIPLTPFLIPAGLQEQLPATQDSVILCSRICSLAISIPVIVTFCYCEAVVLGTPMSVSVQADYWYRPENAIPAAIALFIAIFLLQRFFKPGERQDISWKLPYLIWVLSFLMLKNCTWDLNYFIHQDLYWLPAAEIGILLATLVAPLIVIYARRFAVPVYVWCCLNPLFFAFIYGHFSRTEEASIFAPLVERLGWLVVGINEISIGRFVDIIQ